MLSTWAHRDTSWTTVDTSTAFLTVKMPVEQLVLLKPPAVLVKLGLLKENDIWIATKAVYGLRSAPRLWEESRDDVLRTCEFTVEGADQKMTDKKIKNDQRLEHGCCSELTNRHVAHEQHVVFALNRCCEAGSIRVNRSGYRTMNLIRKRAGSKAGDSRASSAETTLKKRIAQEKDKIPPPPVDWKEEDQACAKAYPPPPAPTKAAPNGEDHIPPIPQVQRAEFHGSDCIKVTHYERFVRTQISEKAGRDAPARPSWYLCRNPEQSKGWFLGGSRNKPKSPKAASKATGSNEPMAEIPVIATMYHSYTRDSRQSARIT
eukprot:6491614-Amphidinium_carterae.1